MKKKIVVSAVLTIALLAGIAGVSGKIGGSGKSLGNVTDEEKGTALTGTEAVAAAADGNWGLSFQTEGAAPIGNATVEYLKQFDAWYVGTAAVDSGDQGGGSAGTGAAGGKGSEDGAKSGNSDAQKCIYLTFDAGYENGYTEKILDVLKEEKVPAAFFLVGNYITENPDLVKRMVKEGHIVGNHTMHHPDMSAIAEKEDFEKELEDLEAAYKEVTGKDMKKFYRPPQGKYSETNLMQAHEMGYQTIFWSLAYVDWYEDQQPTREEALNTLNKRIHPGAIVLLHSTSKTNGEILQELIQGWKQQGYVFKSLEEL